MPNKKYPRAITWMEVRCIYETNNFLYKNQKCVQYAAKRF